jgi:hypothetical protein
VHAALGIASNLRRRERGIPERHDDQRDEAALAVAAPFVDHPVVVREDARVRELAVFRFEERLAAEARERRERQRRVDPVHLHVVDARLRLVATRAHLVVGDRRHCHVVAIEADGGDVTLVDVDEILVDPAVGLRPGIVECLLVDAAPDVAHRPDAAPLHVGSALDELRGEPLLPEVRGLDDVVVDTDDLGQFRRHGCSCWCRSPGI